jgi:hypothetical protein
MKKTISGLVPLYSSDYDNLNKIKIGEEIKVSVSRPRNYLFHKKYFALINLAFENQDQYTDITTFRYILQMKAGYFEPIKTDKGIVYLPQSISFAKMDEDDFSELYSKVLDVILAFLEIEKETLENELHNFL